MWWLCHLLRADHSIMLKLKNAATGRVFVSVSNNFLFIAASCLSSHTRSSPSPPPPFHSVSPSASTQMQLKSSEPKEVAASFKEWLKSGNIPSLERIWSILSDHDVEDRVSCIAVDSALSQLCLPLSESFVVEVLRYGSKSHDVLSCLKFFDWAGRQQGFQHTPPTFHAIFKIMSRAKGMLVDFLENYVRKKDNFRFYDVIVMGYAVVGKPGIALQMFCQMRFHGLDLDAFAYHVLLNALVEENWFDAVKVISKQISKRGFENEFTRSVMLKSLCKQNRLEEGETYIRGLIRDGHALTGYMVGHLVDAFCRNNKFGDAGRLIVEFQRSGMVQMEQCFATWINNLVQAGKVDGSLEKLDEMKELILAALEQNFRPGPSIYNLFISTLCRASRVEDAYVIHQKLNQTGNVAYKTTYVDLIRGFCCSHEGNTAAELLIEMQEKGHYPSWELFRDVVGCLCHMDDPEKQFLQFLNLQLSQHGHSCRTYNIFIDCARHVQRPKLALEVFGMMFGSGIQPDLSSVILLLQSYLISGQIPNALTFFSSLTKWGTIDKKLYNTMIVGLCKLHTKEIALKIFKEAKENKAPLSLQCYEEIVMLLCSMEEYGEVFNIVVEFCKFKSHISSFMGNTLLLHSLKSAKLYTTWVDLTQNDTSLYIRMLGCLIGAFSGCMKLNPHIEDVEKAIQQCFPLTIYSYNILLRRLSIDQMDRACALFSSLCQKGYQPNQWTYGNLAWGFFRHANVAEAKSVMEEMSQRGFVNIKTIARWILKQEVDSGCNLAPKL